MGVLIGMAICAKTIAQTNLIISFTNTSGEFVKRAEVTKILPNKIYYRTEAGGGSIRLDALPSNLQEKLGYDAAELRSADLAEKAKRLDEQRLAAANLKARQLEGLKAIFASKSRTVSGKIIQKIPEGLLVESGQSEIDQVGHTDVEFDRMGNMSTSTTATLQEGDTARSLCLGLVLLEDHPRYDQLVDDNVVVILAYPDGQFSYKSVGGGQKTVRKFTADFNRAFTNHYPAVSGWH